MDEERKVKGEDIESGEGKDNIDKEEEKKIEEVVKDYEKKEGLIEKKGGRLIMMERREMERIEK